MTSRPAEPISPRTPRDRLSAAPRLVTRPGGSRTEIAAGWYARQGFDVFPLWWPVDGVCACPKGRACGRDAGKHPLTEHGFKDASREPATIARWWGRWPRANVGITTGITTRTVVIDVDPRAGGDTTWHELTRSHGRIVDTPHARTGGGGVHVLFARPRLESIRCGSLGPGVDVKADAGYIVAAPSVHVSGRAYTWETGLELGRIPLAPLPGWIVERLTAKPDRLRADGTPLVITEPRNVTLTKLGGALRRYGIGEAAIRDCLRAINREHCVVPLDDGEVQKIARSVARYAPGGLR